MFRDLLAMSKLAWPVAFVALPCALMICLLVWLFPDAIEAYGEFRTYLNYARWRGPGLLFMLNSAVLGWVSIVVLERKSQTVGIVVFLATLPWCLASIAGGFALSVYLVDHVPGSIGEMVAYSVVSAVGASAFRTHLQNVA